MVSRLERPLGEASMQGMDTWQITIDRIEHESVSINEVPLSAGILHRRLPKSRIHFQMLKCVQEILPSLTTH